jgi:hypothetical protein
MTACMTPPEQELWNSANRVLSKAAPSPCYDCPFAFALEMRQEGCCDGEPRVTGRPRMSSTKDRERWRRAQQAKRDRAR